MMNSNRPTRRAFLRQVLDAIEDDRLIACHLPRENGECTIAVYGLVFQKDKLYVVGVKRGEAKVRIWDHQQLESIRVLDDRFEMPPEFSLEKTDVLRLMEGCGF